MMNQKSIACIALLLSFLCITVYSQDINISVQDLMIYNKWRISNKRTFMSEDEQIFRQIVFFENLKVINKHNSDPSNTYTVGINEFSDMTEEEFESKILNNKLNEDLGIQSSSNNEGLKLADNFQQSPSVDWRTKGAVTPVKNQGSCGSCWTFSTTALMESVNFIKKGVVSNFAEQQLLDCVTVENGYKSNGCSGGFPYFALSYATKYGIVDESQYPYVGKQGQCKVISPTNGFKPQAIVKVKNTANDLKNALNNSPVAVSLSASNWGSYKSGIFNNCGKKLNHGVLAVGYDTNGNWIIKNSWGAKWGENGFMRIDANNNCSILTQNFIITV